MSIAKTIIYGTDKELIAELRKSPRIDELDEYGYTPLVQAAIVNSVSKTKLLLAAGASVDFTDLTGRTALFWAADNANYDLCRLLLQNHANPNAYTNGGQPILALPMLKKQQNIKSLLTAAGAKVSFAQDFINAKLLGHSFELEGRIDIVNTNNTFIEVEFEGFFLRFTLEIINSTLIDLRKNFVGQKLRKYFTKLDMLIRALEVAIDLIRYQHYLVSIQHYVKKINELLDYEPLILPIAFGGHAVTLVKLWDWLIRCDRGEFGKSNGTVIFYQMQHPTRLTKTFCRQLLYKRQYPEFINTGLDEYLGLEQKWVLPLPVQKSGNCAWANVEALIPALMFLLLVEEQGGAIKTCAQEAFDFYEQWREWNKTRELDFCLQNFQEATPARRAAKAALLGAILFQGCDYTKPTDQVKANKILKILLQPDYNYVLQAYIKVFKQDKDNQQLKDLREFLDVYGANITDLEKL